MPSKRQAPSAHGSDQPRPGEALPSGTLTFCFTDIEGSTQLWEQHPRAMPAALARHDAILRNAITTHRGIIFKTVGDGVHAVFASAADALAASINAQRALQAELWHTFQPPDSARSNTRHPESKFVLRVRVALHSGVAEQRAHDYFGPALNRVARMLDLAHGGQILLSHAAYDLSADELPEQITLLALGEYQLKDLTRPEQIFQLVSPDLPSAFPPLRTFANAATPAAMKSRQTEAPLAQLLATKLYVPSVRSNLVPRQHLIDRLHAGLSGRLTLIAAPAGFGKTTLLASWIAARIASEGAAGGPARVAWVALDKGDNDPIRFWSYVIAALETLRAGVGAGALALLQSPQPPPIQNILTTLLNALSSWETPVVLMLDDYHTIDTPSIHQEMAFLLDHLPPQLHLVITSRADPPLPLSRLRARGELNELRAADLRFTPDEAAAFLAGVLGVRLSAETVAALEARTEGWIAGLQFAALAMRDHTDHASFIAAFTGSNRFVMDYLVEEVLQHLPQHLHTFLLEASILDRLCGPLCDAVLGVTSDERQGMSSEPDLRVTRHASLVSPAAYSQLILDQLERANLFLGPLDDQRHWYRFHPLFAEVLRSRLTNGASAAHVATLHQRASRWFEQQGLEAEAIAQALFTGDHERIAHLIERYAWPVIYRGQIHTALGWFNALSPAFIRTRPTLCVLHAQMLMHTNRLDAAESRLQEAEQALRPDTPVELARSIQGRVLTTRANISFYHDDLPQSVALGQQALDTLPEPISIWRPAASAFAAHSFLVTGDVTPEFERQVAAVAPAARASGNRFVQLRGYTLLGEFQVIQGRLKAAAATYRLANQLAPEPVVLASMIGSAAYYFGLGDLYREWNDLAAAEQLLTEGISRAIGAVTPNAFYLRQGCIALARLQHACGDGTAALATLAILADLARKRSYEPLGLAQARAVQAQLSLAGGQIDTALQWADTSWVHADDPPSYPRELEHLTLARVLIAKGRGDPTAPELIQALSLLDRLLVAAEAAARMRSVLEITILRALALAAQGNTAGAHTTLEHALAQAAPEGYIRIFVDEGAPMRSQIADCRSQIASRTGSAASYDEQRVLAYADTLLAAFPSAQAAELPAEARAPSAHLPQAAAPEPSRERALAVGSQPPALHPPSSALVEPLSERELEVLRLIGAGHSNQTIADTLIIAVSTVKRHINNIYGKLDVQSRTQALARARELRLL